MRRTLIEYPLIGFKLSSFGASLALACLAALFLTDWRARRLGLRSESVQGLAVWLVTGGFIGARLLYLLGHPGTVHVWTDVFKIWQGGIVFYGCILGGLVGSILYWRRNPFPFLRMADAVAPSLALGSAIGRAGCFLNGCCFGAATDLPWAVHFPPGSLPWTRHVARGLIPISATHSLDVHPTQLYAMLDGFILLGVLTYAFSWTKRDGQVMALLMVTYPVTRFCIEALRDDEPAIFLGMTLSQWISVLIFTGGVWTWWYLSKMPARGESVPSRETSTSPDLNAKIGAFPKRIG